MICASCGKHVAGTEARCSFCGVALEHGVTPSSETHPAAGGGTALGASDQIARQRRAATACLLLGLFSLATLPVVFALVNIEDTRPWEHEVRNAVLGALVGIFVISAILAGVLALVLGCRANALFRRTEGTTFGDDRARRGVILGAIGAGIWILLILNIELQRARFGPGWSPVGSLSTINTAAITYASQYGHGFPLRLSYLGYDPSKKNDQAAGLIDKKLASGTIGGYRFYYVAGPLDSRGMVQSYTVHADPLQPSTEHPYYFTDQTGIIRKQSRWEANATSPPVD